MRLAHEDTLEGSALRERLRQVYWVGGGSDAGKTTIARRTAARNDLQLYATDEAMAAHADLYGVRDMALGEPGDPPDQLPGTLTGR